MKSLIAAAALSLAAFSASAQSVEPRCIQYGYGSPSYRECTYQVERAKLMQEFPQAFAYVAPEPVRPGVDLNGLANALALIGAASQPQRLPPGAYQPPMPQPVPPSGSYRFRCVPNGYGLDCQ